MNGTFSEVSIELLKKHENHQKMAIITWTAEDVREAGAEYNPIAVFSRTKTLPAGHGPAASGCADAPPSAVRDDRVWCCRGD